MNNPKKSEIQRHGYLPRLTLIARNDKEKFILQLKIEFSAPKILYGNNFDELTGENFYELIAELKEKLKIMGVVTTEDKLIDANISAIHSSKNIILDKYLMVINSHHHFDHIGGNSEFEEVHIHRFDFKPLMKPVDISFLKPKNHLVRQILENKKYRLQAAQIHRPLEGGEQYNLGHIKVEVVHTPGHTSGSICLLTDNGELFTGDTVHHGAIYLPSEDRIDNYLNSLTHLIRICEDRQVKSVYPAHEEYPIQIEDILALYNYILNRKHYAKRYDQPLDAWIIEKNQYSLIFPKEN
ncbi:MAG: MBL fold metallo-hydrolase [Candidatus Heimdallarchaeota archaeon]|nr:MBL fold metallo-hydrolase [Candidatus Heimdallarchaeota archaeon]